MQRVEREKEGGQGRRVQREEREKEEGEGAAGGDGGERREGEGGQRGEGAEVRGRRGRRWGRPPGGLLPCWRQAHPSFGAARPMPSSTHEGGGQREERRREVLSLPADLRPTSAAEEKRPHEAATSQDGGEVVRAHAAQ